MAQQTLINGNRYSFVNLTARVGDLDLPKGCITALNYTAQQDPGIVQGNLNVPMGRTQGYATASGSIEILLSEALDFMTALTGGDPLVGVMDVDFSIIVSYSVNDVDVTTDTLLGCRITSLEANNQQGNDATKRSYPLSIMRVNVGGINAFAPPQE